MIEDLVSFPAISAKLWEWKNALSRHVEESFEKFLDPDWDAECG